ncbi:MAG TPA: class I SAM-dependent methyltransferase family protein [Candidatus Paceibacterota bacterium]|nr:class I SAM-dependent methyltransferase family protein [Candidatus Paceibacterota bacterium]
MTRMTVIKRPLHEQRIQESSTEETLEYERLAWPYRLALPMMFLFAVYVHLKKVFLKLFGIKPAVNIWLFDGVSINGHRVKEGAAQWSALDAVYNFKQGEGGNIFSRAVDSFWLNIRNAQAVRNRLILVKQQLKVAILDAARERHNGEPIRILSLAAGAAQGVIEVVADLFPRGIALGVVLIDQDSIALAHALKLAKRYGIGHLFQPIRGDVRFFDRNLGGQFSPEIIEMCGLMDYLRSGIATRLIRKIYRALPPGGTFLTCHIHPNAESYFLRHVVDWKMLYRTLEEFGDILVEGEFLNPSFFTEPLGIHSVAVAKKVSSVL